MGRFPDNRKVISLEEGRRVRALQQAEQKQRARRTRWASKLKRIPAWFVVLALIAIVGGGFFLVQAGRYARQFGSWNLAFKHIAAAPNCDAARRAGLGNARKGQPGYYVKHDADHDGVACEPYPR